MCDVPVTWRVFTRRGGGGGGGGGESRVRPINPAALDRSIAGYLIPRRRLTRTLLGAEPTGGSARGVRLGARQGGQAGGSAEGARLGLGRGRQTGARQRAPGLSLSKECPKFC